uniref:Uncharacterized protein n=1 Tax=Meloidogyne enterolobii TaxID=390850 RepID=A0A6V7Y672_MELEN|nr:unnamed protein product [Meloidogyne enterolobii]
MMENTKSHNKNKNKLLLPLELLFDIIKAANKRHDSKNIIYTENTAMILELKEYFIKLMSCSTILYAYFGENLIKLFRKLKVNLIKGRY